MKNMAMAESIAPAKALCQLKNLKPGRKLGAEPIFSKKQAMFIVKNVNWRILLALVAHTETPLRAAKLTDIDLPKVF